MSILEEIKAYPEHLKTYDYSPAPMILEKENDSHLFFEKKSTNDKEEDFSIIYEKGLDSLKLNDIIYFNPTVNKEFYTMDYFFNLKKSEDSIPLFISTFYHITTGQIFAKSELESFSFEQLSELAKYASIKQFNEICNLKNKNSNINHSLAIRYLFLLKPYELGITDFCSYLNIPDQVYFFMREVNLEADYFLEDRFIIASVLSQLDTPPTFECITLFQDNLGEHYKSYFFFEYGFYKDNNFLDAINGLENIIDKDSFLNGYRKHFKFAIEATFDAVDSFEGSDMTLTVMSEVLDNLHRYNLDNELLNKLFNYKTTSPLGYISGWGDNWTTTHYFDFEKGNLFDHWIAHKHECIKLYDYDPEYQKEMKKNVKFVFDNITSELRNSPFNVDLLLNTIQQRENTKDDYQNALKMKDEKVSNYDILKKLIA